MKWTIFVLVFFISFVGLSEAKPTIVASAENSTFLFFGTNKYENLDEIVKRIDRVQSKGKLEVSVRLIVTDKIKFQKYAPLLRGFKRALFVEIVFVDELKNYDETKIKEYLLFKYLGAVIPPQMKRDE